MSIERCCKELAHGGLGGGSDLLAPAAVGCTLTTNVVVPEAATLAAGCVPIDTLQLLTGATLTGSVMFSVVPPVLAIV